MPFVRCALQLHSDLTDELKPIKSVRSCVWNSSANYPLND
jgi:hypothetical protein